MCGIARRARLRTDPAFFRVRSAVQERVQLAKAKRSDSRRPTIKAYSARRLRARAGTIVAPGPHFFLSALRHSEERTSGALGTLGHAAIAADEAQVPALRHRATGRCWESALRVYPGRIPSASPPTPAGEHRARGRRHRRRSLTAARPIPFPAVRSQAGRRPRGRPEVSCGQARTACAASSQSADGSGGSWPPRRRARARIARGSPR